MMPCVRLLLCIWQKIAILQRSCTSLSIIMNDYIVEDKSRINTLLDDAYALRVSDLSRSVALAEEARELSNAIGDKALQAKSLSHLSLFYMIKGEYTACNKMAEEALALFGELGDDKGMADVRYNLAGM